MNVVCPCCRHSFSELYFKLGMPSQCPGCGKRFDMQRDHVIELGNTGWQITCTDFLRLLRDSMTAEEVESYIAEPLGLRARPVPGGWIFFNPEDDSFYDPQVVHSMMQMNPGLQGRIYRYAMDRWR
ncbi:hypothetical protein [Luteolibacter sp. Populi]|uniref:hypothetical protein n=1 Tax=Luteolibacter sp. Populi TaxID=3230487 RepID=UPI00346618DD